MCYVCNCIKHEKIRKYKPVSNKGLVLSAYTVSIISWQQNQLKENEAILTRKINLTYYAYYMLVSVI